MAKKKHSFLYRNSLSIVMLLIMMLTLVGQIYTGLKVYNDERLQNGAGSVSLSNYLTSGHFLQSTFENWESEFLQMSFYVVLTIFLRQKGSSESKDLDKPEPVDREPKAHANAPWPVKKGGWWLKIYNYSLTIALLFLFIISFAIHFYGSLKNYNEEQHLENLPAEPASEYLLNSEFWFESFQNWQSEFLSVAAIVLLSIWLRQKGSPESKPVDTPHYESE
jgi:hypothetical protein